MDIPKNSKNINTADLAVLSARDIISKYPHIAQ
jgi:hypothetical protein